MKTFEIPEDLFQYIESLAAREDIDTIEVVRSFFKIGIILYGEEKIYVKREDIYRQIVLDKSTEERDVQSN